VANKDVVRADTLAFRSSPVLVARVALDPACAISKIEWQREATTQALLMLRLRVKGLTIFAKTPTSRALLFFGKLAANHRCRFAADPRKVLACRRKVLRSQNGQSKGESGMSPPLRLQAPVAEGALGIALAAVAESKGDGVLAGSTPRLRDFFNGLVDNGMNLSDN
jgi:hypothetical protein